MRIEPFFDTGTSTLTYVVFDEATKDAVIIDPVLDYDPLASKLSTTSIQRVLDFVASEQLKVHYSVETHVHADHLTAAQQVKQATGARIAVAARVTEVQSVFKDVFDLGASFATDGSQFDVLLDGGGTLTAGSLRFTVLPTPGHTPADMSLLIGDAVFTGDTLFHPDLGVGRCDFPKGDAGALYDSVTKRLYTLPDATRVYPGHDYPPQGREWKASSTIAEQKASNVQLPADKTREDFVEKRTARDSTLKAPKLLYPSVQVNLAAGQLPAPSANGKRYLKVPLTGP